MLFRHDILVHCEWKGITVKSLRKVWRYERAEWYAYAMAKRHMAKGQAINWIQLKYLKDDKCIG